MQSRSLALGQLVVPLFLIYLACGPATAADVLMLIQNSTLNSEETARRTQLQSWGHTVTTIQDSDTQANIDTAVAAADVVYVPCTIDDWDLLYKLRTAAKGVVTETMGLDQEFGFGSTDGYTQSATTVETLDNTHEVTAGLSSGTVTITTSNQNLAVNNNTIAPGMQILATRNFGGLSLGVMESGATLANTYSGNSTASGRRVHLPWGYTLAFSSLNSNGLKILQQAITWAVGKELVAQWKLNEASGTSAADATGNAHTGTVTGTASWTSAVINNGFTFDGATKIQATGLMGSPTNITVAAWVNLTSSDTNGAEVISLGDHFGLRVDEGSITKAFYYNGSSYITLSVSKTYAGTGWHHFAAVFDDDNNSFKLYVDGAQVASSAPTTSISYSGLGSNTVIGRHGNAGTTYDLTGTVDDVRVYNYALSASEVIEVYGLVAYWKLNEASGTSASDSSGLSHTGTVTGTATWTSAVKSNGFSFNGSTKIQATGLLNNPADISVAAWANLTTADTNGAEVITLGDHFVLRLDAGSSSQVLFYDGSTYVTLSYSRTFAGTGWHHFAATFDGANNSLKLYVDGALAASTTTTASISYTGLGSDTRIGTHGVAQTTVDFNGTIDDVRVYNYPLSASAVAELYGLIAYWKLDEASGTTAADSSGFGRTGTVTGTTSWTSAIRNNGFSFNGSTKIQASGLLYTPQNVTVAAWANLTTADTSGAEVISLGDHFVLRLDEGTVTKAYFYNGSSNVALSVSQVYAGTGWHHFVAMLDDDNNTFKLYVDGELAATTSTASTISYAGLGSNTVIGRNGNASTAYDFMGTIDDVRVYNRALTNAEIVALHGLVGRWKLVEASGTSAADSTLNANNGTYTNGVSLATSSTVPGYGVVAAVFDGTNDYVATSNESLYDLTGPLSVAAWIKVTAFDKSYQAILTKGDTSWRLARDVSTNNVAFGCSGLTTNTKVISTSSVNDAKWHHLAGVYDGSTLKLYVDGTLNNSATATGTVSTNAYALNIGKNAEMTSREWHGAIYDARVYNRAITAEEVDQLYGTGSDGVRIIKWVEIQ